MQVSTPHDDPPARDPAPVGVLPSPAERRRLDEDGFVSLGPLFRPAEAAAAIHQLEGLLASGIAPGQGGTLHLDLDEVLPARAAGGDAAWLATVARHPRIVGAVQHVLGAEVGPGRSRYRAPRPGFGRQSLHVDWSAPVRPGEYVVCNAFVALTPFTAGNGATRVVPGSHRGYLVPGRRDAERRHPDERQLVGPAGTVFVVNGHVWHAGARNDSDAVRHAVLVTFARAGVTAS